MDEEVNRLRSYHILNHQQRSKHGRLFSRWSPRAVWASYVVSAPILSLGAIALFSVAGSEAAVERTFSAQGIVHNQLRNRLNDDAVEAEMYCTFNAAALKRKPQERDLGSWVELTDSYEEVPLSQLVTANLFLARVAEEVKAHEEERKEEEERRVEEGKREIPEDEDDFVLVQSPPSASFLVLLSLLPPTMSNASSFSPSGRCPGQAASMPSSAGQNVTACPPLRCVAEVDTPHPTAGQDHEVCSFRGRSSSTRRVHRGGRHHRPAG